MGTRADFYVGRHKDAEWIGSIAWDGYEEGMPDGLLEATDEATFRATVREHLATREDFTDPCEGWPWPWTSSYLTDYAYMFDPAAGKVVIAPSDEDFPDMSERQNVTLGQRSGVTVVVSHAD